MVYWNGQQPREGQHDRERKQRKPELFPAIRGAMPDAELLIVPEHKHEAYVIGNDLLYTDFRRFFGVT